MSIEDCFEVKEKIRNEFMEENIVGLLPEEIRESSRQRAQKIINNYVGVDRDAISILAYAAERNRFDEFAEKLEKHYKDSLEYVHPEARRIKQIPGAVRACVFFIDCYKELGIKPASE
jgi:hypothetical protein